MIKLFATDIDHTLYSSELGFIPEKNIEAINKLINKGVTICLASSRGFDGVMEFVDLFDLRNHNGYVAVNNGAYVVRLRDNKVLLNNSFNKEEIKYLYQKSQEYKMGFIIIKDNCCLATDYCKILDYNQHHANMDIFLTNHMEKYYDIDNVCQLAFFNDNEDMYAYYDKVESKLKEDYNFNVPQSIVMDISKKGANKFSGIEVVMKDLGITVNQIATMGDNDNDIPMLENAFNSACVSNGSKSAQKAAKHIVSSDANCGVAEFINNYLLNED